MGVRTRLNANAAVEIKRIRRIYSPRERLYQMRLLIVAGLWMVLLNSSVAAQQVPKGQMPPLGRPTQSDDTVPLFDFDTYFLGKWDFEWTMPETVLGPAGPYSGTTVVKKLDGRFYEAV